MSIFSQSTRRGWPLSLINCFQALEIETTGMQQCWNVEALVMKTETLEMDSGVDLNLNEIK